MSLNSSTFLGNVPVYFLILETCIKKKVCSSNSENGYSNYDHYKNLVCMVLTMSL